MKIAIIGTGISGMLTAYLLNADHDITVFEANGYVGGHTNTMPVQLRGETYAVDTGFMVFNHRTYPNFTRLLAHLGVASQPSTMSFSVKCEQSGLEYNGTSLNTLFAQRRNLLRPTFYRMLRDILRFHREAVAALAHGDQQVTLGEYLVAGRYSREFIEHYIVPMGAAIWSADPAYLWRFPARFFIQFFHNHGMLSVNRRPQWRTISRGAQQYIEPLTRPYRNRIRLRCPVHSVRRHPDRVEVKSHSGETVSFDQVVVATHSDQALALLADPSVNEHEILDALPYQENEAVLHTDASLLPQNRRAWASWNSHLLPEKYGRVTITYNLNILQNLRASLPLCVTLNRADAIDPAQIIRRITYHHPVYTLAGVAAQQRYMEINGVNRTYFCGAYWGYGFHEDGVNSALAVCRQFGREL
jgi:uncharacterized protein